MKSLIFYNVAAETPQGVGLAVIVTYFTLLGLLCVFGLHRFLMIYLYYRNKKHAPRPAGRFEDLPSVTVQLPVFNELYVVERLIDAACALDYPRDRLEIQVLDDSTDDSVMVTARKVEAMREKGYQVHHVRRPDRVGYKAGALEYGMGLTNSKFFAIFDADFVPDPGFLQRTIHHFTDEKIGLIQTRWGHLNRDYSLLTRLQSIFLDGHFVMEHAARSWSGRFFNFSGTGGIWRRAAIEDAGGWQHDTLTEDLDLSFRSQLSDWRFIYLNDIESPAELPVDIRGFKSQQNRWVRGSMQTSRKMLGRILSAPVSLKVKFESVLHLTGNLCYLLMFALSLIMFPAVFYRYRFGLTESAGFDLLVFFLATCSVALFYLLSQREIHGRHGLWRSLLHLPLLLSLGIGMCVTNTFAVLSGLLGKMGGEFIRTPKYAISGRTGSFFGKKYRAATLWFIPAIELIMGLSFLAIMIFSASHGMLGALPFQGLFAFGFLYVAFLSFFQGRLLQR